MTTTQHELTAYSPLILETLHALIAPGRRVRLSPFVESAQYEMLFGKRLTPQRRYEQAREILKASESEVNQLAQHWINFVNDEGKKFHAGIYDEAFLRAYLIYYFSVNVGKLQLALFDLLKSTTLPVALTIMDIGVAAGATFVAVLDFFIGWSNACNLYGIDFPIESINLVGIDANENCLGFAPRVLTAFTGAIADRLKTVPPDSPSGHILQKVIDWSRGARWEQVDINESAPIAPDGPVLLVASNVVNELGDTGREHIGTLIEG